MKLLQLFLVALMPVLKLLIITGLGLILALDRLNILGPDATRHLNHMVFYVFTPSIIASYMAETVTIQDFIRMWFMPVNILITFIIGSILGWILLKITRAPPHVRGLVIGCCAAGNLGNLPLIIVPAICNESSSPFGDTAMCLTRGEAYVSLSMAISSIYIWSYVYMIVSISVVKSEATLSTKEPQNSETHSHKVDLPGIKYEFPISVLVKVKHCFKAINLKMLFSPPTIAAFVGFTIGVIAPLRKLMIGEKAPLRVIDSSVYLLGGATVPSMTLIIGANLLKGFKKSGVGVVLILGIIVARYMVLPAVGIGVVKAARHLGMVGSDSLYQFVLMLQYALPPASSVGTMTQMFEAGEGECSVIMLWTYLVAAISLALWSTLFLWLVS